MRDADALGDDHTTFIQFEGGDPLDDKDREQLADSAPAEFAAVDVAQKAIITALHPEDGNGAHSPARVRRPRAVANGGNTAGQENGSRTSRRRPARGLGAGNRRVHKTGQRRVRARGRSGVLQPARQRLDAQFQVGFSEHCLDGAVGQFLRDGQDFAVELA